MITSTFLVKAPELAPCVAVVPAILGDRTREAREEVAGESTGVHTLPGSLGLPPRNTIISSTAQGHGGNFKIGNL